MASRPDVVAAWARELPRQPVCYGHCGFLGWTVEKHGRVTHKQACPHRAEPWCQAHPEGCPDDCEPVMWKEWNSASTPTPDPAAACGHPRDEWIELTSAGWVAPRFLLAVDGREVAIAEARALYVEDRIDAGELERRVGEALHACYIEFDDDGLTPIPTEREGL